MIDAAPTLTHWIPDDDLPPCDMAVLADMNCEGRIVAVLGTADGWMCGESLFARFAHGEGVSTWLIDRLRDGALCPMLLPLGDAVWCADPRLYLSTGLLLLSPLPAPPAVIVTLAERGMLGPVALFPGIGRSAAMSPDGEGYAAAHALQRHWEAMCACLPREGTEHDPHTLMAELLRLIRTVTERCGCEPISVTTAHTWPTPQDAAQYDLPMLAAVLLLLGSAMRRCGLARLSASLEACAEGILVTLCVPDADGLLDSADELACCRALAARNCQLFDAATRDGVCCLHVCAVRKDFSLLGIKTRPELR